MPQETLQRKKQSEILLRMEKESKGLFDVLKTIINIKNVIYMVATYFDEITYSKFLNQGEKLSPRLNYLEYKPIPIIIHELK